jgi:hypothetical protein
MFDGFAVNFGRAALSGHLISTLLLRLVAELVGSLVQGTGGVDVSAYSLHA